jgi:TolA-binding protein
MSTRPDDWDQDERQALSGLEDQLETIRRRHAGNPPLEMLRAARAGALPDEAQADVETHLAESAWSRALVDGLEAGGDELALDRVSEERLWARIRKDTGTATHAGSGRRWAPWVYGGTALAASVLIAVGLTRESGPDSSVSAPPAATSAPAPSASTVPSAPVLLAFSKPDIKLSAAALTWRGAPTENPFLLNLKPAVDAYRDGDYVQADARFTELSVQYPRAVEVAFFLGVTRMLRDDFAGARAPLADALAMGDAAFTDDASWFLAVAEQRSGGLAEARGRLAELCAGSGRFKTDACAAEQQLRAAEDSSRQ